MFRKREKAAERIVGIEVCESELHFSVGWQDDEGVLEFHTQTSTWRQQATSLHSKLGRAELTEALKRLVAEHKLYGAHVYLALNGDFCVTRVVAGTEERVRNELNHLEKRSALYLSLGHGRKAFSASVQQIDARHQHGLLAVVNQRTLEIVLDVCIHSGLQLELVEPSLVSLCRLVGRMSREMNGPALIINLSQKGAELGITHNGRPLLDYRPAAVETNEEVASVVLDHLARLERYCERYASFAKGALDIAYLCGDWQTVDAVGVALEESGRLDVQGLEPPTIDAGWKFEGDVPGSEMSPALGACLLGLDHTLEHTGPNLMEGVKAPEQTELWAQVVRVLWPVAAMLVVSVAAWGFVWSGKKQTRWLKSELASYEKDQERARSLKLRIGEQRGKITELSAIQQALPERDLHALAERIGHCLPEDVWLDAMQVDPTGSVTLSGASFSEDGVFEFIRWLQEHPELDRVALQGTQPTRLETGPATRFDVYCAFAASAGREGTADDDG